MRSDRTRETLIDAIFMISNEPDNLDSVLDCVRTIQESARYFTDSELRELIEAAYFIRLGDYDDPDFY